MVQRCWNGACLHMLGNAWLTHNRTVQRHTSQPWKTQPRKHPVVLLWRCPRVRWRNCHGLIFGAHARNQSRDQECEWLAPPGGKVMQNTHTFLHRHRKHLIKCFSYVYDFFGCICLPTRRLFWCLNGRNPHSPYLWGAKWRQFNCLFFQVKYATGKRHASVKKKKKKERKSHCFQMSAYWIRYRMCFTLADSLVFKPGGDKPGSGTYVRTSGTVLYYRTSVKAGNVVAFLLN